MTYQITPKNQSTILLKNSKIARAYLSYLRKNNIEFKYNRYF